MTSKSNKIRMAKAAIRKTGKKKPNAIDTERVNIALTDANSSCLITAATADGARYVVMPMRL